MSIAINAAETSYYTSLFNTGGGSNWLADTFTAIQNQDQQGGLLGMLANSGGDGSIDSFMNRNATSANNFALIAQNGVTSASSLFAQIAAQNQKDAANKKLQEALDGLSATQQTVQPKNTLDPFIYFPNGSYLDTNNNILTMADGTQYDTTTGAKYVDPASIIQMANGAYLDTKNNILTQPDGTQIDTVTGLLVSKTA